MTALPEVPGVLSAAEARQSARAIAAMQEPDGALPWEPGAHTDVWNHVESAMGLLVAGEVEAAERAYDWCLRTQRFDGSWPIKVVAGHVEDGGGETNMSAYLAVGVWHHWLVRADHAFASRAWPAVRRALDWVVSLQLDFGGIAWSQEWDEQGPSTVRAAALLAGSSSIFHALRAGVALADLLGDPQPEWELAGGRLGHALREHRDRFLDKSTFAMDWYYPVLGGAVRGEAGFELLAGRWEELVVPGLGVRCVDTNPWVTVAESAELVLTLDALGDRGRALELFASLRRLRCDDGAYWTGYVYNDEVVWPRQRTTYTTAAVLLAADALCGATPGAGIVRGETLPLLPDLPCSGCTEVVGPRTEEILG
ncbi:prenyltransferase [Nocardioides mangrovicus]|uniref:Prenyltransferase n=1 Tax=Nocardioides mangrovicus TaxID=2478913 RepID=A0A3L8P373_9ACTN|nr:prenyltransferase [Nocardioides mangrovicus]RLV49303.1 prenyltransferase [Nocardioides mangrovicus]